MPAANLTAWQGWKHKQLHAPFLLSALGISDFFPVSSSLSDINNLKSVTRSRGKAACCNTGAPASSSGVWLGSCLPFWDRERVSDFPKDFQGPSHEHEEADVCARNRFITSTVLPSPICYGEPGICTLLCREKPFRLLQNSSAFKGMWYPQPCETTATWLQSAMSFIISTHEAYRMKDHTKPLSDEASDGSTGVHWQLWSLSHSLHIHFTALMFSANTMWIIEAWAAPRRCLATHSREWQNWDKNTGFWLPDVWSCHISGI